MTLYLEMSDDCCQYLRDVFRGLKQKPISEGKDLFFNSGEIQ